MQRILVVDDDPIVTNVLRRGLSYEGYRVDTAATGRQALTMARDHTHDVTPPLGKASALSSSHRAVIERGESATH